jgi:hypothetical protein
MVSIETVFIWLAGHPTAQTNASAGRWPAPQQKAATEKNFGLSTYYYDFF